MRVLIAGGGTGGHLFPGVAIAEELRARDPEAAVQFVGTARGLEARVLPELGWDLALIQVSGLKTVGVIGALRGLVRLPRALWQARRIVKQFRPDAVIGVGGYASGPVVLMARLRGHMGTLEKVIGGALVLTGVLFLTGGMPRIAGWLLETFPVFSSFG